MAKASGNEKIFGIELTMIRFLVVPILITVVFLVSLFLIIIPRFTVIQDTNNKARERDNMTKSVQEKINYLSAIDPNELKTNADRLNSAIFAEKNSYYLIDIVRGISEQFGFQIQDFSLSPGEVKQDETEAKKMSVEDAVTRVPVEIILVGPRSQFLGFVEALEKNLPVLSMDKFLISTEQDSTKLDLTLVSYYIPTQNISDILKLTLADMTLSKEESDTLNKLGEFKRPLTTVGTGATTSQGYVKYDRPNPFAL